MTPGHTVHYFVTARSNGNARARGGLPRLLKRKGWPSAVATAEQIHGVRLAIVPSLTSPKTYPAADGLLTDRPGQPLAVFTADCVPVFLASRDGRVAGVLHAGWRGMRAKILAKAAGLIRRRWGLPASSLQVWAGPAIGACCYDVGWDVARHFPSARRKRGQGWQIDLQQALRRQARALGVRWRADRQNRRCTRHEKVYHSFRRDRTDARQASVILIRPEP